MEASEGSVCSFIRKPTKTTKNIRKRRTIEEHEENDSPADDDESSFLKTNNSSRRKSSTHENNSLYFSTPAGSGRNIFQFEFSKNVPPVQDDGGETAPLEPEFYGDERAVTERALKRAKEDLMMKGGGGAEKLYGGIRGYRDHKAGFRREQRIGKEKAGGPHGPLRASEHIRVAARFDYQPDVCKDYKETGYCGYGDSCKFMHNRGDYKNGWQLEKEWEEAEKKARERILGLGKLDDDDDDDNEEEEEEGDSLPFACSICRQPFQDPVVTKCKHYFCGHCALKHHEKKKKCFVCNQPTLGNFNTALELRKRMVEQGKQ